MRLRGIVLAGLLVGLLAGADAAVAAAPAIAPDDGRHTYTGTIDGADYRVETPHRWNGTLVLYSHGYAPPAFPPFDESIALTNRPTDKLETQNWLLEHGYALAASRFKDRGIGYQVESGQRDQLALLDWFDAHVGRPRHTVSTGQSMGAAIAVLLAERNPHRFDGVATMCGAYDSNGTFNAILDMNFAIKTLLLEPGEDTDLVRVADPIASTQTLVAAVQRALGTAQGRARLALVGALNNVPGWYSPHQPRPTDVTEWIRQQAAWIQNAYVASLGPSARPDLERRAGGNPSWNVGIDYGRQLVRSSQSALVRQAYRSAGLDLRGLRDDLDRLAAAPRIAPDWDALAYMYRVGVARGSTPAPVITMHTTGDGGAVADQERWYGEQVRRFGDPQKLRQLYVDRGAHCSFNAAEEITMLRTLFERIDTDSWPDTSPRRLTGAARELGDGYELVFDFGTWSDAPVAPAFTRFEPPRFLRPSR